MNSILNFKYIEPNFNTDKFTSFPNACIEQVKVEGVAPDNYHATSIYPEYFKINDEWILAEDSRMDSVIVVSDGKIEVKELRKLKVGDNVVIGRSIDGIEGIYIHKNGFVDKNDTNYIFSFRSGRSRETSFSKDYDRLYELLKHEKTNGYIVWVLGPAVVFDKESRNSMVSLIENGFVHAILAGNALATHDIEASVFGSALGQDIYTQESYKSGHYNHLDVLNKIRKCGSIEKCVENGYIKDGIMYKCIKRNIPFVLAGSIRDDGPIPEVITDVYDAQDKMREYIKRATTILGLATQLHSIAVGNMTPSYKIIDGTIRPVFIYSIDISEFAVNKLKDRGTLECTSIVTNVQDFLQKIKTNLIL